MKRISILCALLLFGCNNPEPNMNRISVMIDVTDPEMEPVRSSVIKPLSELSSEKEGMSFSLKFIDASGFNTLATVELSPAQTGMSYDRLIRRRQCKKYRSSIDTLLMSLDTVNYGRSHSNVFAQVLAESKRLHNVGGGTIYLFSDLAENSEKFSVLRKQDQALLEKHNVLVERFKTFFALNDLDLSKVEIVIHHKPQLADEHQFKNFYRLYESLFQFCGARVRLHNQSITRL